MKGICVKWKKQMPVFGTWQLLFLFYFGGPHIDGKTEF